MKKKLVTSYIAGVFDQAHGESYWNILTYFVPEFISSLVLLLLLIDAQWVSMLKSTSMYATVGTTNTLLHVITKLAEGFCVGTIIMTGHFNGLEDYKQAGRTLVDAFWVTFICGALVAGFLFFGAYWIFYYYGVPTKMIMLGVPYLRLKALSIFFMFIYFGVIGFLRGIKKPRVLMQIFMLGAVIYLFFDYVLIFGKLGFPEMQLQGSAIASVIQYAVMLLASFLFIFFDRENRKYGIALFSPLRDLARIKELFILMLPVMIDKATLAAAYMWLGYMINPMGISAIASLTAIKDLERFAILPAAAFANVITFLVSNAYGRHDWDGIKCNIKKTVFLSALFVFSILLIFSLWPSYFIGIFDSKNKFTAFSARIFPMLSVLVFFDLLQLILSGALRGAANVNAVMWVRLAVCVFYFMPVSWIIAHMPFESLTLKFLLVYSSFYMGNALMSVIYIYRFRGERWQKKSI
jgi:MATE family multidrug resistance protein